MAGPQTVCVVEHNGIKCGKGVVQIGQRWYHEDGTNACIVGGTHLLEREPDPVEPHCDFCNGTGVRWTMITRSRVQADVLVYKADTLEPTSSQTHNLSEDWAACHDCYVLIQGGAWRAMAMRCIDAMQQADDDTHRDELIAMVLEMWEEVWKGFEAWRPWPDEDGARAPR